MKVRKRTARFTILNDTMYKRGFSMPYLKCVNKEEANYILEEIYEGICGDHAKLSKQVTFGLLCRRMQKSLSRGVTNAKDLGTSNASHYRN